MDSGVSREIPGRECAHICGVQKQEVGTVKTLGSLPFSYVFFVSFLPLLQPGFPYLLIHPAEEGPTHHVTWFLYLLHPQAEPSMNVKSLFPNSKFPGEENLISPFWMRCLSLSHQRR